MAVSSASIRPQGPFAVPIYQTAAYAFDSAEHGAALFNLEAEGFRYTRINNPTTDVLDKRVAALEGGVQALSVWLPSQAALHYAVLNVTRLGKNLVSVPQLYGTTHTLFFPPVAELWRAGASLRPVGPSRRYWRTDRRRHLRGVLRKRPGNPAGNICDVEAIAAMAHEHGVPLIVDNTVATPIMLRPIDYGAEALSCIR